MYKRQHGQSWDNEVLNKQQFEDGLRRDEPTPDEELDKLPISVEAVSYTHLDVYKRQAKYVKWSIADLPILPQKWQYLVSASTKKQFGILQKLMHRSDVDSIVNSCDSGREGELIFRLVYQQARCKKPFSRLWLSSMEESAIREGFANLKPSTEYDALYNAALCRERADWLVGINASRLFSCLYGQPLAVGRVMTPVLAMTVVREAAIAAFVPEKFCTVALTLADGGTASSKRFAQKADAELLLSKCRKEGRVTVQKMERKEKSESPP